MSANGSPLQTWPVAASAAYPSLSCLITDLEFTDWNEKPTNRDNYKPNVCVCSSLSCPLSSFCAADLDPAQRFFLLKGLFVCFFLPLLPCSGVRLWASTKRDDPDR